MKLTCKCGATLEMADEAVASPYRMDKFIDAHAACLLPEVHNHQHLNLDEAFWLNTFAGAAMQGILAHEGYTDNEPYMGHAVKYATALLEEVKKHGKL